MLNTGLITTVAGTGLCSNSGDGGPATLAAVCNPSGITVDPAGNLYISDSYNDVVRRVDALTGNISTPINNLGYYNDNIALQGVAVDSLAISMSPTQTDLSE